MEKVSRTKSVFFRFYILCENFSKIGPIIKKIPKFQSDPLKMVVRIQCPVKLELKDFAGKNATCDVFNEADRTSWCWRIPPSFAGYK